MIQGCSEGPKATGHCQGVPDHGENPRFLFMAVSENPSHGRGRGPVIPTSAASRSSVCSSECRRESPGRGRQEAWSPPGEGAAPSCSVSGTSLGAVQGPTRRKCRAALQSSVRFTPGPAVQLCLISSGIASLPTLNTILPWIHDYRSSLCDAFLGVSLSTPKGRRQLGLTRLRCGVLS